MGALDWRNRSTDQDTDRQTNKHTDRHTYRHSCTYTDAHKQTDIETTATQTQESGGREADKSVARKLLCNDRKVNKYGRRHVLLFIVLLNRLVPFDGPRSGTERSTTPSD